MERGYAHSGEERQTLEETSGVRPRSYGGSTRHRCVSGGYVVRADLPESHPVTRDEIALLRAFLSDEIRAILNGEDEEE